MSMRSFARAPIAMVLVFLALAMSLPVEAHHQRKNLNTTGISIPNLAHGQLRIVSTYWSAILNLADHQISPDLETRTLQNFANLQYAYCLWGLAPGSLTYENNPFNECSHAYLAASRELLDRLRQKAETRAEAEMIVQKINTAMLIDPSAFQLCANSLQPFNTAQIIMPEWANVTFNPLAVLLGAIILGASAGLFALGRAGRPRKAVAQ